MANNKNTNKQRPAIWVRNVAKSLGYTGIGTLKEAMPGLSDTISSTKEVVGEARDKLEQMKELKGIHKIEIFGKLNVDSVAGKFKEALTNAKEDILSGNINNKAREDKVFDDAFGTDDFDFNFDDDFSFDLEDDNGDSFDMGDSDDSNVVVPDVHITANIGKNNPMVKAVQAQTTIMSDIANDTAKRESAIASTTMSLTSELASKLSGNIGTVNSNIAQLVDFNSNVMNKFVEASTSYYESSLNVMGGILLEVKKITTPKQTSSKYSDVFSSSDIFQYGGGFDLSRYIEAVKKNIKNYASNSMLGSLGSMIGIGNGEDSGMSMLDTMIANPIGTLMNLFINMPEGIEKVLKRADTAIGSFLPALINKIGYLGENIENPLFEAIGKIFGLDISRKRTLNLSNYERGPVPFDGIVRKSIVEVIPTYLSRILAAISKDEAIVFDYENGVFKNVQAEKAKYYEDLRKSIAYEFDDMDKVYDAINEQEADEATRKRLLNATKMAMVRLSETKGKIDPRDLDDLEKLFSDITDPKNPLIQANGLSYDELEKVQNYILDNLNDSEKMRTFAGSHRSAAAEVVSNKLRNIEERDPMMRGILGGYWNNLNRRGYNPSDGTISYNPDGSVISSDDETHEESVLSATDEDRLENLKKMLRRNRRMIKIPRNYLDLPLDDEARKLLDDNNKWVEEHGETGFKLFKGDNAVSRWINDKLEAPLEWINEKVEKMEHKFFEIIFGKGEEGEPKTLKELLTDFGASIKDKISGWFDTIHEKLFGTEEGKKGFFTQIKESDFFKGMTEKGTKVKDWVSKTLFGDGENDGFLTGVKDTFTIYSGMVKEAFTSDTGVKATMKDTVGSFFAGLSEAFGVPPKSNNKSDTPVKDAVNYAASSLKSGFQRFGELIFGPKTFKDGSVNRNYFDIEDLTDNLKDNAPDATAHGLIGAGVGSIIGATSTGLLASSALGQLVLGPIGGAALGFAGTFLARSDKFQNLLFGEKDIDGNRVGGLISKKTQDWAKENKNLLIGGGGLGAIGGIALSGILPGFILGGPIPGAIFGMATSMAMKSDAFQKTLFGEKDADGKKISDGLIDTIKKKFSKDGNISPEDKKRIIGTIGAGGVTGLGLAGIFAVNPLIGAGVGITAGLMASSKKWTERIFGKEDEKGVREGGLLSKFTGVLDKHIIKPLIYGAKSLSTTVQNWFAKDIKETFVYTGEVVAAGVKGFFSNVKERMESTVFGRIGKWLKNLGGFIMKGVSKLFGLGRKVIGGLLKGGASLFLKSLSFLPKSVAAGARGLFGKFIDKDTKKELKAEHKERLKGITLANKERNEKLKEYRSKLETTNILTRLGDSIGGMSTETEGETREQRKERRKAEREARKAAKKALVAKYGKAYNNLSSVEQARINTEEAQAQDVFTIRQTIQRIAERMGIGGHSNADEESANVTNDTSIIDELNTDNISETASNVVVSDINEATMDSIAAPLGAGEILGPGGPKHNAGDMMDSIESSNTEIPDDELNPETNRNVAESSKGVISGLTKVFTKGGPLSFIGEAFSGLKALISPFVGKIALFGIAAIGIIRFFTDPVGFLTGVVSTIGNTIKSLLGPLYEWYRDWAKKNGVSAVADDASYAGSMESLMDNLNRNPELLKSEDFVSDQFGMLTARETEIDNIMNRKWYNSLLAGDFTDADKNNATVKKRKKEQYDVAVELNKAVEAGIYKPNEEELAVMNKYLAMDPSEYTASTVDKIDNFTGRATNYTNPLTLLQRIGWKLIGSSEKKKAKEDMETRAEEALLGELEEDNKSKAIGESNVDENSTYYLHSGEGVLTPAANHLFGGSETTAGVLNAYARNNVASKDASAIRNIMGGTLGTSGNDLELMSRLADASFANEDGYESLIKYAEEIRNTSSSVPDGSYWKYDEGATKKYGPLAKLLFKTIRFANYPARLVSSALGETADGMEEIEQSVSGDTVSGGASSESLGSRIKKATTGVFGKVMGWVSNIVGGIGGDDDSFDTTTAKHATTNGNNSKQSKIDLGMNNEYYKFPSYSIDISDMSNSRTTSFGTGPHRGLDLLVRDRSNPLIKSFTGGEVLFAGQSNPDIKKSYGNMIQIQDENGMYHLYGHLDSVNVKAGDKVNPGDVLGVEGTTGQSDGNHLHYEVGTGITVGGRLSGEVHPAEYMEGYNSGSSTIKATPLEQYQVGSFWDGTSGADAMSITSNTASRNAVSSSQDDIRTRLANGENILSILYSPFMELNNALKGAVKGKKTSGANSGFIGPMRPSGSTEVEGNSYTEQAWNYLTKTAGFTKNGAAGILGNMQAESGIIPNNLENYYETSTRTDESYTASVDNGSYSRDKFANDRFGYGLVQWTDESRKPKLYDYIKSRGLSIGDMGGQLGYLIEELNAGYPNLVKLAKDKSASLQDVSDEMLTDFERPANANSKKAQRAGYGREILAAYGGGGDDTISADTARHFKTPQTNNKVSINTNTTSDSKVISLISETIQILSQIANNTKQTNTHLINIETQNKKSSNNATGSATNSEMYDIANSSKIRTGKNPNKTDVDAYNVAKTIARGF